MASKQPVALPTKEEFLDFSRFDLNAILRGVQLTFVGAQRALQNPGLWTTQHYRQAAIAVACGIAIRVLIEIPIVALKITLWFLSFVVRLDTVTWDDALFDGLRFLQEYVLQMPLFLMTLMRHLSPALDDVFMQSLQWVDYTYAQKHARDGTDPALMDPRHRYYENLRAYAAVSSSRKAGSGEAGDGGGGSETSAHEGSSFPGGSKGAIARFLLRFGRKAAISLAVFALSYIPIIGRFVLPAASFWTFRKNVGLGPATLIFGLGLFLPRRYLVVFLQTYYGQRSLMRELLGPYFARVRFTAQQKRNWFASREALLFGFGAGFYVLLRVPLVGVLVYGIAEASTAYLVTKITDPPPPPAVAAAAVTQAAYAASQQTWHSKRAFLELALDNLDALNRQPALTGDPDRPGVVGAAGSEALNDGAADTELRQRRQAEKRVQHQQQQQDPDRPHGHHSDPPPPYSAN